MRRILVIPYFLFSTVLCAQDQIAWLDTLPTFPIATTHFEKLDSVSGTLFDSINHPKAYLFESRNWYENKVSLALKRHSGYDVIEYIGNRDDKFSYYRTDFNGKGSEELVIYTESYSGHSGWTNSVHERWGTTTILDLDAERWLFSFQTYYSMITWWQEFADTADTIPFEERRLVNSGGDATCETYSILIEKKKVKIRETADCPDQDENNHYSVSDSTVYVYELKGALIRMK